MSTQRSHEIRCPRCAAIMTVQLYDAVNVSEEPALRDDIFHNRLNRVECPQCGFGFRVDKPLLYLDARGKFAIWWEPDGERDPAGAEAAFERMREAVSGMEGTPFTLLLVFERRELIDRILVCEAGLDARVVEYVKYLIHSNNPSLAPARRRLWFAGGGSGTDTVSFAVEEVDSGRIVGAIEYPRAGLDEVAAMFRDHPAGALAELFPRPRISARTLLLD